LVNYMSQAHIANFPAQTAAGYVAFYWGGAMLGRFIGAAALRRVETRTLLAFCALCSTALITVSLLTTGYVAMWSMIAVGLFNSVMFPSIFALGVAGLGPLTGTASGVLSMAIAGGAVVPVIQGALADSIGVQRSFFLPAICYLYIIFYALKGATPDSTRYVSDLKMGRGSVAQ
ncbi:MAG TPA: hypothetical protein VES20_16975, partial [Bryobacteraceae bacterium]|nr:hypothetical protein [Bryobacteraceae bacterium]